MRYLVTAWCLALFLMLWNISSTLKEIEYVLKNEPPAITARHCAEIAENPDEYVLCLRSGSYDQSRRDGQSVADNS